MPPGGFGFGVATENNWPPNAVSGWFGGALNGLDPVVSYGAGGRPFDVAVGDVNNDRLPDLVAANLEGHSVTRCRSARTACAPARGILLARRNQNERCRIPIGDPAFARQLLTTR